jgi:hypothetical protein
MPPVSCSCMHGMRHSPVLHEPCHCCTCTSRTDLVNVLPTSPLRPADPCAPPCSQEHLMTASRLLHLGGPSHPRCCRRRGLLFPAVTPRTSRPGQRRHYSMLSSPLLFLLPSSLPAQGANHRGDVVSAARSQRRRHHLPIEHALLRALPCRRHDSRR